MYRSAQEQLQYWKIKPDRKPLILRGARQVGKTWLMKEFASTNYRNSVYVNFEDAPQLHSLFVEDFDIDRILKVLEIYTGEVVQSGETLLILDEIQAAERALTSLKYFHEKAPGLHVIAAGSLLGVSTQKDSFPVGKVDFLDLYPLSFTEFLIAFGEQKLVDLLRAKDFEMAIQWLVDAGLIMKVCRVTKPELPLAAFEELNVFKLFLVDLGLLSAMCALPPDSMIIGNELFLQFKGALTEQYVHQQLLTLDSGKIAYWTNERSTNEVDFIVQKGGKVIPIEVKAESNVKSKSFRFFCEKYQPKMALRLSLKNYSEDSWMTNIPLYAVEFLQKK